MSKATYKGIDYCCFRSSAIKAPGQQKLYAIQAPNLWTCERPHKIVLGAIISTFKFWLVTRELFSSPDSFKTPKSNAPSPVSESARKMKYSQAIHPVLAKFSIHHLQTMLTKICKKTFDPTIHFKMVCQSN